MQSLLIDATSKKVSISLSREQFNLLKSVDFSEMNDSIFFNDKDCEVSTDNLWLLQTILTEEITTQGLTPDRQNVTKHGEALEALYDEIYYLTSKQ